MAVAVGFGRWFWMGLLWLDDLGPDLRERVGWVGIGLLLGALVWTPKWSLIGEGA